MKNIGFLSWVTLFTIWVVIQGFAIGNGLTDPAIQYKAYTDYALEMGIIKESQYKRINIILPVCEAAIKLCGNDLSLTHTDTQIDTWTWYKSFSALLLGTDGTISCMAAYVVCNAIFSSIISIAGNINVRISDSFNPH